MSDHETPSNVISELNFLPKSVMYNAEGIKRTSDEILQRMGIPKQRRKAESKLPEAKQLANRIFDPGFRYMAFALSLRAVVNNNPNEKVPMISWEYTVFNTIKPMWFKLSAFSEIQEDIDREWERLKELLDYSALDNTELRNKSHEMWKFIKGELFNRAIFGLYLTIQKKSDGWKTLNEDERKLLAEQVWAICLFFKTDCITDFLEKCEGLFEILTPNEILKPASSPNDTPKIINSAQELYAEIDGLVRAGLADPSNLGFADTISALLSEHLPKLKEKLNVSPDEWREILNECIETILQHTRRDIFSDFNEEEFVHAFSNSWLDYFLMMLKEKGSESLLSDIVEQKITSIEALTPKIEEEILNYAVIETELAQLNLSLTTASFKEKPDLKRRIAEGEEERVRRMKGRNSAIDEGYNALLPEGLCLDDLATVDDTPRAISIREDNTGIALYWRKHGAKTAKQDINGDTPAATEVDNELESESHLKIEQPIIDISLPEVTIEPDEPRQPAIDPIFEEIELPNEEIREETSSTVESVAADVLVKSTTLSAEVKEESFDASLSHFVNDAESAGKRLAHFQHSTGAVPGIAIENIALLWVEKNNLPMAAKTLRLADQLNIKDGCLPYTFIEAAYHGQHTWKNNQASLTPILNSLNNLTAANIEEWMLRRPVGRIIPYLVFGATFQPALFAGNMTTSPRLLSSVADFFDAPIARLIEELVEFTDRNQRFDIETLMDEPKREDKDGKAKLVVAIKDWHDKIINKQTGWAPVRNAMKLCLETPEFTDVKRTIEKDDVSNVAHVRAFADKYRGTEAQQALLQEHISMTAREKNSGHVPIEGNARKWFTKSIVDIVSIADTYVEMSAQSAQRTSDVSKFARRFMGLVSQALAHVNSRMNSTDDLEHKAGLALLKSIFENVNGLASGVIPVWESLRVDGWYSWPRHYLFEELSLANDDAEAAMAESVDLLCRDFPMLELSENALEKQHYHQAMLLALQLETTSRQNKSQLIEKIRLAFVESKHSCARTIEATRVLLDNAYVSSVADIDADRHYQIGSELEHLYERLNNLTVLESINEIKDNLASIKRDLEKRFDSRIGDIRTSLDEAVNEARVRHGAEWLPNSWLAQLNLALANHDTTIAEEMLEHLKSAIASGDSLSAMVEPGVSLLNAFLAAEPTLFSHLDAVSNPRDLVKEVHALKIDGLDFSTIDAVYKPALVAMKTLKSRNGLDKVGYDFIVNILESIGLRVTTPNFSSTLKDKLHFNTSDSFSSITCKVKRLALSSGMVFFSEDSDEQAVNVIWVSSAWTTAELNAYVESKVHAVHDRTLLLHCGALHNLKRNEFAGFCKSQKHTIYHVDLCLLAFMAALNISDGSRFKTFLQLSLPWTYSNPYTGSAMQPAPPEMRYGRSEDIKSLTNMRNGAAIVFGGRQLGKTTLLKETQRRFNSPSQSHYAFMKQMDGNLDRAKLSSDEFEKHRYSIWSTLYNFACESNMLKHVAGLTTEQMEQALYEYFGKNGEDKLLVCLDEIDPILALDAAHSFGIFRKLTGLVNGSFGRFKVVIAGLENTRKFGDAANFPLHQLGSAVQVSIMTPTEALQLIREPMAYLGYEFESPLLMNRILVETNRHPGLIHIFCNEMINRLSARHNAKIAANKIGSFKITAQDIDVICKDKEIRQLICDRFNITLSLDLRYQLIAYSLIGDGQPSFTPSRAKAIVQEWAPDVFSPMTEAQFEAFLEELRGLGVLQFRQRSDSAKEYSLRNANILNLVGGTQAVEDKLLRAIEDIKDNDPMDGHAFNLSSDRPSPLALRDEKLLISDSGARSDESSNIVKANSSTFSVGVIVGSEALGLNPQWMAEGLTSIGEEEKPLHGNHHMRYQHFIKKDVELEGATGFKKMLSSSVDVQARTRPIMLFIQLTGELPISQMLDLIDTANQEALSPRPECHRIRIIFLVTPKALWSWVQHPELTSTREEHQTFISLGLWKNTAMAHLLNRLNLAPTSTSLEQLLEYSQGWYLSVNMLLLATKSLKEKKKKFDGLTVSELGGSYTPLLEATGKTAELFLSKTGLMDVSWARPVLETLSKNAEFDEEDFQLELLDNYSYVDPHGALKWLSMLRLIEPSKRHQGNAKPTFRVNKSVKGLLMQHQLTDVKA